ncbi:MAG: ADP-ribosylglycohydrolase family protein, partial [Planctomycetes bacterium]|nr:ADP-ribosylglycohydrolase family protein [Planctomycetota bacterium]
MNITYDEYYNRIHGGWLGKCIGGTIGARFEGHKEWIEIEPDKLFPDKIPPNDDLDLQILWLDVLEKKGANFTSENLADAWLEGCWYPFNEYGVFRRNWRLGIVPPVSGTFSNPFWGTGMGCPIRSEIWGYVCPGKPDLAADFSYRDGCLDHTAQSVGAEMMWAAAASLAFTDFNIRSLIDRTIHYLPAGTPIEKLSRMAIDGYDAGKSHREVRDRILANAPCAEACDSQINVPFTVLGLLYGEGDLEKTLIYALNCGYDTDCTLATAGALLGQILGADRISKSLKKPIGDELVMGIQYRRKEMTISALTRDTARIGVLFGESFSANLKVTGAPEIAPLPRVEVPEWSLSVTYEDGPCAAPGDTVGVTITAKGKVPAMLPLSVIAPEGWVVTPERDYISDLQPSVILNLHLKQDVPVVNQTNKFEVKAGDK